MGADIHASIEVRDADNNIWYPFAGLNLDRDYFVFGALAGVRGGEPVYAKRGLPRDKSYWPGPGEDDGWGDHSFSWLFPDEFRNALASVEDIPICYVAAATAMEVLTVHHGSRGVRLVFGFDS